MTRKQFDIATVAPAMSRMETEYRKVQEPTIPFPVTTCVVGLDAYVIKPHGCPPKIEIRWYDEGSDSMGACWIDTDCVGAPETEPLLDQGRFGFGYFPLHTLHTREDVDGEWLAKINTYRLLAKGRKRMNDPLAETARHFQIWLERIGALRSRLPERWDDPQYHVLTGDYGEIPDEGVVNFHLAHDLSWEAALTMVQGIFYGENVFTVCTQSPDRYSLYLCNGLRTWALIRPSRGDYSRVVPSQLHNLESEKAHTPTVSDWGADPDDNKNIYKRPFT